MVEQWFLLGHQQYYRGLDFVAQVFLRAQIHGFGQRQHWGRRVGFEERPESTHFVPFPSSSPQFVERPSVSFAGLYSVYRGRRRGDHARRQGSLWEVLFGLEKACERRSPHVSRRAMEQKVHTFFTDRLIAAGKPKSIPGKLVAYGAPQFERDLIRSESAGTP